MFRHRNTFRLLLGLIALPAIAACSTTPAVQPGVAVSQPNIDAGQQDFAPFVPQEYILRPSDVISVTVFREQDLSLAQVPISAGGQVSFPLLGSLDVSGMTPNELELRLEELFDARYLRDPDVAVNVVDYASHQVTVEGAVALSGLYQFQPGTRLSGGIALAQGLDRVADAQQIAVFRETSGGMQVAKFDYAAVRTGTMLDPVLQPGDRIVVGTDGLSQFWQDLLKALPIFALFTNVNF